VYDPIVGQARWSEDEKAQAVQTYADTSNLAEAQRAVRREDGTTPGKNSIKRWAVDAGHDIAEITARAVTKTQQATAAQLRRWQDRRATMLHEIGGAAQLALDSAVACMAVGEPSAAKDYATVCAIFVDKAQVLSGDATHIVRTPWDPKQVTSEAAPRAEGLRSVPTGDAATA
jgi:hypothetical protein